ncbi:DUF503 domain-containing protein [Aciduricibacillus chroicocephali]|uniref:DUF503 domain-containing protein n=1 Tax=Aciduricibacillus chroicocephali TaxID=3054939 RepID=A0ABY9KYJ1_9BACI|nr:DUF503 domain-containing protein [Bacillaceae bacterium 44XB]
MILSAEVECILYDGHSLKEKRSVLKPMVTRLRQRYNISIAELDHHDVWQRTKLGIAVVANEQVHAEQVMQRVLAEIDENTELERTITNIEFV